jgi:hypothetical protein
MITPEQGKPDSIDIAIFKEDAQKNKAALVKDLLADEINDKTEIGEIVPVIHIRDSVFAVKGDISIVGGLPKVGKTSVCAYLIATAFMKNIPESFDSLCIRTSYCEGKEVFYIDTEQPKAYTNRLRKMVKKLLNLSDTQPQPENLKILNLRKHDSKAKLEKVMELMKHFPETHLWIIDGVADLIRDPNDVKESFGVIEKFMMKSDELNTAVVLHIHENPGNSGKLRGNLGSEAERKCGGAIAIKKIKEKGIHSIEPKVIRGSEDFEPVYFRYSKEHHRMVSLDATEAMEAKKSVDKNQVKFEKRLELARKCTNNGKDAIKYSSLVDQIMFHSQQVEGKPVQKRTAENRVVDMCSNGILILNEDKYVLESKYIPQP